jgi:hypothetical protein
MNRKKQMNTILKKRTKKEKAKLAPKTKSTYIAKAKRVEIELEANNADDITEAQAEQKAMDTSKENI